MTSNNGNSASSPEESPRDPLRELTKFTEAIDASVGVLEDQTDAIEDKTSAIEKQVASLTEQVGELKEQVKELKEQLEEREGGEDD
jgi:peptidoglycan hydrolase CwlO-like protein